jgi:hypothetical protein
MSYTFSELKTDCNAILWPEGTPENLTTAINSFYQEAMVDISRYVPCLQERNESVYEQCSTYFRCGTTWFDAPKGYITKVYVTQGDDCQPVTYHQTTPSEITSWSRRLTEIVDDPLNDGLLELKLGFKYPEQSTDSTVGRALTGLWALDARGNGARIILAPWIQSDESIVVEWSGVKSYWGEDDPILDDDDSMLPLVRKAARMYVRHSYEDAYVCDKVQTFACKQAYDDALAELIHECRERTRQRKADPNYNETRSLYNTFTAPVAATPTTNESTTVLAAFGDYGVDDANELAVANLVKGWSPNGILALGDNNYETGSASTIDTNVGKYFADYIYPYLGSYDSTATENKFWPVLGNHDLDTDAGGPYTEYFPAPISQRFYDVVIGNVHVFAINSGINTAGTLVETAGNTSTSIQAEYIRDKIIRSTAKWKLVILHHSPYTNGSTYTPGLSQLRWPFESWGVDAVLSGHSHVYERIEKSGFPYYVVGTGGRALDTFIASPVDQKSGSVAAHGALKITATCKEISFEFINVEGTTVDDGSGGGGYEPPSDTFALYWGRSTNTTLTGVQIQALSSSASVSSVSRTVSYVAGTGYLYFACPDSEDPTSMMVGAFALALAGSVEGYASTSNGLTYTTVTVGSTLYRLYRTYNTLAGVTSIVVS